MPCVDHDYKNCPAYIELKYGEQCHQTGCQRKKAPVQTSPASVSYAHLTLPTIPLV